jgi:PAS domain S-box-containing protein
MLSNFLQDRAVAYASGALGAPEREEFELMLEFHEELRGFVMDLSEVGATLTLAGMGMGADREAPSAGLKDRVLGAIANRPQQTTHEALVVSTPEGLVHWVSAAFSKMCGYSLDELRGKKLGPILQGVKTDRATADRLRTAVQAKRACQETILNYHKDGTPYWVEIAIAPIADDAGVPLWLVARERELNTPAAA